MNDQIAASTVTNTDPMPVTAPAPTPRIAVIATVLLAIDAVLIALVVVIL